MRTQKEMQPLWDEVCGLSLFFSSPPFGGKEGGGVGVWQRWLPDSLEPRCNSLIEAE